MLVCVRIVQSDINSKVKSVQGASIASKKMDSGMEYNEMRRGGETEVDSCREVHLPPPPLLCGIKKLDGPGDKGLPQPV